LLSIHMCAPPYLILVTTHLRVQYWHLLNEASS